MVYYSEPLSFLFPQINYQEYLKLKTRVEFLQSSQRNILGEDLGPLSMKELDQIENQIDASLKHIRSKKNQVLLDQLFELKSKEQELQDENKDLRKKVTSLSCKIPPAAAERMRSICPGKTEGSLAPEYSNTRSMIPPCKLGMFFYMSISEKLVSSGLHGPAEQQRSRGF
ncbi:MADS-box transcription factor 1 [Triticum urartu]|uniref:MADS-box transcription factor 1 n=1 Tax=Triticum urartu TaxID=4572 RepID=M7YTT4_TRIUA|nr:MADS-box transcription factor 1 [Triticum urartu]